MKQLSNERTLDYSEVKTVHSDEECNALVKKGWRILDVGRVHIDANGYNSKTCFILGKPEKVPKKAALK